MVVYLTLLPSCGSSLFLFNSNLANSEMKNSCFLFFFFFSFFWFFFLSKLQQALLDWCHNSNFSKTCCRWTVKYKLLLQQVHVIPASSSEASS